MNMSNLDILDQVFEDGNNEASHMDLEFAILEKTENSITFEVLDTDNDDTVTGIMRISVSGTHSGPDGVEWNILRVDFLDSEHKSVESRMIGANGKTLFSICYA